MVAAYDHRWFRAQHGLECGGCVMAKLKQASKAIKRESAGRTRLMPLMDAATLLAEVFPASSSSSLSMCSVNLGGDSAKFRSVFVALPWPHALARLFGVAVFTQGPMLKAALAAGRLTKVGMDESGCQMKTGDLEL